MMGRTEREGIAPDIRLSCLYKAADETIKFISSRLVMGLHEDASLGKS